MNFLLLLFVLAFLVSSVGLIYFIYFFSIGYGFSIAVLSIALLSLFSQSLSTATLTICALLCVYGFRLGLYLLIRERKSEAYKKILRSPEIAQKKPFLEVLFVWLFCALLYVLQVSPLAFRLANAADGVVVSNTAEWIGMAIMVLGFVFEIVADAQKYAAKKVKPNHFVDTGLYRLVRCPNYLGELILWSGCLLLAIGANLLWWQWLLSALGYLGLVYVIFSGTRRLELRQATTYGNDPEFLSYVKHTPILIPFIPLYSVAKYTFLKA